MRGLGGSVGIALNDLGAIERAVVFDGSHMGNIHIVAQHAVYISGAVAEMRLRIAEAITGKIGGKVFEAGDFSGRRGIIPQPAKKNHRMTAGGRGTVT